MVFGTNLDVTLINTCNYSSCKLKLVQVTKDDLTVINFKHLRLFLVINEICYKFKCCSNKLQTLTFISSFECFFYTCRFNSAKRQTLALINSCKWYLVHTYM